MMSNINITVDEEIDDFTYFDAETIESIEETERNLKNSNRKRYSSIQELREALLEKNKTVAKLSFKTKVKNK